MKQQIKYYITLEGDGMEWDEFDEGAEAALDAFIATARENGLTVVDVEEK